MKQFFFSLLAFVAIVSTTVAQKTMDKGYIKMEFKDLKSADQQTQMGLDMMKGSTMEMYFNESKTLTNVNMMGGMMVTKNVMDNATKKMDVYMDMMGNKIYVKGDQELTDAEKKAAADNMTITYNKSKTKKILGYDAYLATITMKQDPTTKIEAYVTEAIKANGVAMQGLQDLEMKGFPLELKVINPQMEMTIATVEIKETVDESVFAVSKEGYKEMTMEEFQKTMGGMGGGLGF